MVKSGKGRRSPLVRRIALVGALLLGAALMPEPYRAASAAPPPPEDKVVGRWWTVGESGVADPTKVLTIGRSKQRSAPLSLDDGVYQDWTGSLKSNGGKVELTFQRKPAWDQMDKAAPESARRAIDGQLVWQLNLSLSMVDLHGPTLAGLFDPGEIHVGLDKNFRNGTVGQKVTWSRAKNPRKVTYVKARNPLVFVPGIAGSRLEDFSTADPTGNLIWVGPHDKSVLTLDPSLPHDRIVATDVLQWDIVQGYGKLIDAFAAAGYQPYQFRDPNDPSDMSRLRTANCDLAGQRESHPTLFVFPYDWRLSVETAAAQLADYIGCVQRFYPDSQIDIVAHSMGGLVSRRYILDHGGNPIQHLVTIATPWLGAPKAIYTMLTGDFDIPQLVALHSTMKALAVYFQSAHELLPSRAYFDIASSPVTMVDSQPPYAGQQHAMSYAAFSDWLNGLVPQSNPVSTGASFHDAVGEDDWRGDNTGVQYVHIYGVQPDDSTIVRVDLRQETHCIRTGNAEVGRHVRCETVTVAEPAYGPGDGTVPVPSSSRQGQQDLNFKNAKLVRVTGDQSLTSHTGLTRNPAVHAAVLEALGMTV